MTDALVQAFDFPTMSGAEHGFSRSTRGTVRNFVCGAAVDYQAVMALMKRLLKSTANLAFTMFHSRGGIFLSSP